MLPHPHPLYVSRPAWLRLGEAIIEVALSFVAAIREAAEHQRLRAQRARERAALHHLSLHTLRDIGADDELLAAARARESSRTAIAEPWRHGL